MKKLFLLAFMLIQVCAHARYFDSKTGSFISRDPIGYRDGHSLYQGYFSSKMTRDPRGTSFTLSMGKIAPEINHFSIEQNDASDNLVPFRGYQNPDTDGHDDNSISDTLTEIASGTRFSSHHHAGGSTTVGVFGHVAKINMSAYTDRSSFTNIGRTIKATPEDHYFQVSANIGRNAIIKNNCCKSGKFFVIHQVKGSVTYTGTPLDGSDINSGADMTSGHLFRRTVSSGVKETSMMNYDIPIGGTKSIRLMSGLTWYHYHGMSDRVEGTSNSQIAVFCVK